MIIYYFSAFTSGNYRFNIVSRFNNENQYEICNIYRIFNGLKEFS